LTQLRAEKDVRALCESREYQPSVLQIKAMVPLSKTERTAFIDEQKKLRTGATRGTAPRTSSGRAANVRESLTGTDLTDKSDDARKKRAEEWKK